MTIRSLAGGLLALALGFTSHAWAADPPKAETLPMPREKQLEVIPPAYLRTNRYDVWQYHDVDRQGRFRPVVIYSPYGAYYKFNGQVFPWASTQPRDFKLMHID